MTSDRATSYRRVLKTLRDLGPAKLWPSEQDRIREAADALLFCDDLQTDPEAGGAFASAAELTVDLVDAERWTRESALELMSDIWACGPGYVRTAVAA
jgi:hypothetical protein